MSLTDPKTLDTLAFAPFPPHELFARAETREGVDLFEHELGFIRRRVTGRDSGKPSLCVFPDGPATLESYDDFIAALRERFNIVILEIPGFGFSYAKRAKALEFEASCGMLADAIADLGLPRLVLVGPCVQALHAARVADLRPDLVDALILAQSGDVEAEREWAKVLDPQGALAQPYAGQIAFRLTREKATLDWWLPFASGPKTPTEQMRDTALEVQGSGCCYALASQLQDLAAAEIVLRPSQPAAVVWGLADRSHANTDRMSTLSIAPGAEMIEREDLAHFPDIEDPELIAETALRLLASGD